jgi:hypothetical protein
MLVSVCDAYVSRQHHSKVLSYLVGGVGILASGPLNAKETREAIHQIRDATDKPFGVG